MEALASGDDSDVASRWMYSQISDGRDKEGSDTTVASAAVVMLLRPEAILKETRIEADGLDDD